MPAARICSSRYGSSSSTTNSRSTVAANARMASMGSGWIMPSLRKAAPGSASLALQYAAPAETTPILAVPPPCSGTGPAAGSTRARSPDAALASANSYSRSTRSRRLRCSGRENLGSRQYFSVLRSGGRRSGAGRVTLRGSSPSPAISPSKRTMLFWCAVWMLRRTITGTSNSSLIAKARLAYS